MEADLAGFVKITQLLAICCINSFERKQNKKMHATVLWPLWCRNGFINNKYQDQQFKYSYSPYDRFISTVGQKYQNLFESIFAARSFTSGFQSFALHRRRKHGWRNLFQSGGGHNCTSKQL